MLRTLPFGALRTLEAVVRLRGFSRAAEELNVTQSAVSQHVKQLEDWLGLPLLTRRGRSVAPTEAGVLLGQAVRENFEALSQLCDDLRRQNATAPSSILVASPPGFAFLWLLPRLLRFAEQHPDDVVNLSTDPQSRNVHRGEADIVIHYGTGGPQDLHVEHLMAERMAPVCAPDLAARVSAVADLAQEVILLDRLDDGSTRTNWEIWAQGAGVNLPRFHTTRTFGQANLVIQAAIDGHGWAMGRAPLVQDALASGKLVQPFGCMVDAPLGYWLLCRPESLHQSTVTQFLEWLRSEA
ncbi:LysR substrate-binding domain-containing protein [Primorskyibacter sp. S187A]|uniref:LysR substrate-binding domain-containing protein n=1 Tax=Primorskyibacter sp. S187A TaxID=3415130 RepID=UPI003C7ACD2E